MEKTFKRKLNPALLYFEVFYAANIVILIMEGLYNSAIVCVGFGVFVFGYFVGLRPYKYTINRKTLIINKRIGKDKEINLMTCETISNPVPKMTRIITNPHALEIYTEGKKRIVICPKDKMEFISLVVSANKRINVQVKEYAATHRSYEKKRRKEMKKEIKSEEGEA